MAAGFGERPCADRVRGVAMRRNGQDLRKEADMAGLNRAGSILRGPLLAGLALLAAIPAADPALADVRDGVDAWARGDYAAAIREWRGPAERGDADAQFNLGQAYKLGRGAPQDLARAEELFAKAAAKGHIQAADNYGLLVFQRGDHAKAMPYISAAAGRGDGRAQYLLGLAHFNGDNVARDWIRAYALVSLAQQAGVPQAVPALTEMDKQIPIEQRRQSVALAPKIAAEAEATRTRELAAVDLGVPAPPSMGTPRLSGPAPSLRYPPAPADNAARPIATSADFGRSPVPVVTQVPPVATILDTETSRPPRAAVAKPVSARAVPAPAPVVAPPAPVKPAPAKPAAAAPSPARAEAPARPAPARAAAGGPWRVQLGAFGVPGNAEALWNRVKNRPELAGRNRLLVPEGQLRKLQAAGFASQADAQAACSRLKAGGFTCIPVRN